MNQTPLWLWDVDQWSLQREATHQMLADWMKEIVRDEIIANFQAPNVHASGTRATSSMERDC